MEQGNANGNGIGRTMKAVYTIVEKPGDKSFWLRIGWANVNRDGSFNLTLDALPTNGKLHVRDYTPREREFEREPPREAREPFGARTPPM